MKKRNRVGFLNILSTCLLYGISIITAPLFSRLLGTGGYGNVSNYNVWVSILSIAATLQTQATLANAMVEFPASEQDKYQSSVLSLSLVCFAVVAALVLLFLGPISNALNLPAFFILLIFSVTPRGRDTLCRDIYQLLHHGNLFRPTKVSFRSGKQCYPIERIWRYVRRSRC